MQQVHKSITHRQPRIPFPSRHIADSPPVIPAHGSAGDACTRATRATCTTGSSGSSGDLGRRVKTQVDVAEHDVAPNAFGQGGVMYFVAQVLQRDGGHVGVLGLDLRFSGMVDDEL